MKEGKQSRKTERKEVLGILTEFSKFIMLEIKVFYLTTDIFIECWIENLLNNFVDFSSSNCSWAKRKKWRRKEGRQAGRQAEEWERTEPRHLHHAADHHQPSILYDYMSRWAPVCLYLAGGQQQQSRRWQHRPTPRCSYIQGMKTLPRWSASLRPWAWLFCASPCSYCRSSAMCPWEKTASSPPLSTTWEARGSCFMQDSGE